MQGQFDITQVCFNASLISTKNSKIICFISAKNGKNMRQWKKCKWNMKVELQELKSKLIETILRLTPWIRIINNNKSINTNHRTLTLLMECASPSNQKP